MADNKKISELTEKIILDVDDLLPIVDSEASPIETKKSKLSSIISKVVAALATVASTGSYNDLSNKPTIPAAQIQSDWNQADSESLDFIKNKPAVGGADWHDLGACTYAASDAPSYTFTISGDQTAILSAGMRIKLTDSTVKYFIITKVVYGDPNTIVTVYGGTDYTLSGGAISSPQYSTSKAPVGFPLSPAKWTVQTTNSSTYLSGANPTAAAYINAFSFVIPVGDWKIDSRFLGGVDADSLTDGRHSVAISTANNSASDAEMVGTTGLLGYVNGHRNIRVFKNSLVVATKTTYYVNQMPSHSLPSGKKIGIYGAVESSLVLLVCNYL